MPLLALIALAAFPAMVQTHPRYRLEPGDRLVYERRIERGGPPGDGVSQRHVEQMQIFCLERRADEWLLLIEIARVRGESLDPAQGLLLYVDSRGQKRFPPEMLARLEELSTTLDVLPVMPASLDNPAKWDAPPDPLARVWRNRAAPEANRPGLRGYEYTAADDAGVYEALGLSQRGRFCFDDSAAIISAAQSERGDERVRTRTATTFFKKLNDPPEWCRKRLAEVERYLGAVRVEAAILDESLTRPERAAQAGQRVRSAWQGFLDTDARDDDSPLRDLARGRLARLNDDLPRFRERAQLAAEWLAKPAAQWSLQDFAGETIRSEDVRDRLTLECFWSAKSPECLRMFSVLRELRAAIDEKKLRIVCLNIDADPVLARRTAERFGGGFQHVLSGPPVRGDAPLEFPVIRVLDRDSRIQRIVLGGQPSLLEVVKPYVR